MHAGIGAAFQQGALREKVQGLQTDYALMQPTSCKFHADLFGLFCGLQ